MSNVLAEDKQHQVVALGRLGWSLRRIEQATGVRRETASGYLKATGIVVRGRGRPSESKTKTGCPSFKRVPPNDCALAAALHYRGERRRLQALVGRRRTTRSSGLCGIVSRQTLLDCAHAVDTSPGIPLPDEFRPNGIEHFPP
jgi:hypothetical protein